MGTVKNLPVRRAKGVDMSVGTYLVPVREDAYPGTTGERVHNRTPATILTRLSRSGTRPPFEKVDFLPTLKQLGIARYLPYVCPEIV